MADRDEWDERARTLRSGLSWHELAAEFRRIATEQRKAGREEAIAVVEARLAGASIDDEETTRCADAIRALDTSTTKLTVDAVMSVLHDPTTHLAAESKTLARIRQRHLAIDDYVYTEAEQHTASASIDTSTEVTAAPDASSAHAHGELIAWAESALYGMKRDRGDVRSACCSAAVRCSRCADELGRSDREYRTTGEEG